MHEHYARKAPKLKEDTKGLLKPISDELEQAGGTSFEALFQKIREHYETSKLEDFPYIGGDDVSGTRNLTGAYRFVSMGEVLKRRGAQMQEIGRLMTLAYERRFNALPGVVRAVLRKSYTNVKSLNKRSQKKDAQNVANAVKNPGSFSKTLTSALRVAFAVLPPKLLERHLEWGPTTPSVNTHIGATSRRSPRPSPSAATCGSAPTAPFSRA